MALIGKTTLKPDLCQGQTRGCQKRPGFLEPDFQNILIGWTMCGRAEHALEMRNAEMNAIRQICQRNLVIQMHVDVFIDGAELSSSQRTFAWFTHHLSGGIVA